MHRLQPTLNFILDRGGFFTLEDLKAIDNLSEYQAKKVLEELRWRSLVTWRRTPHHGVFQATSKAARLLKKSDWMTRRPDKDTPVLRGISRLRLGLKLRGSLLSPEEIGEYFKSKNLILLDSRISIDVAVNENNHIIYVYAPEYPVQLNNVLITVLTALDYATEQQTVCFYTHAKNVAAVNTYLASFVKGFEDNSAGSNPAAVDPSKLTYTQRLRLELSGNLEGRTQTTIAKIPVKDTEKVSYKSSILPVLGVDLFAN